MVERESTASPRHGEAPTNSRGGFMNLRMDARPRASSDVRLSLVLQLQRVHLLALGGRHKALDPLVKSCEGDRELDLLVGALAKFCTERRLVRLRCRLQSLLVVDEPANVAANRRCLTRELIGEILDLFPL